MQREPERGPDHDAGPADEPEGQPVRRRQPDHAERAGDAGLVDAETLRHEEEQDRAGRSAGPQSRSTSAGLASRPSSRRMTAISTRLRSRPAIFAASTPASRPRRSALHRPSRTARSAAGSAPRSSATDTATARSRAGPRRRPGAADDAMVRPATTAGSSGTSQMVSAMAAPANSGPDRTWTSRSCDHRAGGQRRADRLPRWRARNTSPPSPASGTIVFIASPTTWL